MDPKTVIGIAELGDLEHDLRTCDPIVGGSRPIQPERAVEHAVYIDGERLVVLRLKAKPCVPDLCSGGLSAYLIRGGAIALRDDDAARITIEKQVDSTAVKLSDKCKHSLKQREVYYE